MQIVIVAGGGGARLWPLSTKSKPKQFVKLIQQKSLLQYTFDLLCTQFAQQNIWISTNVSYRDLVLKQIPDFNTEHLLLEPEKRDSFPAEATALAVIAANLGDEEVVTFVPCDDYWPNPHSEKNYLEALSNLETVARTNDVAILGIKPSFPSTEYGYIQLSNASWAESIGKATPVASFEEKPIKQVATQYVEAGTYLWHTHSPTLTYRSLIKILQIQEPKIVAILEAIREKGEIDAGLFLQLPKVPIDTIVLEKAENVSVIGIDADWEDIGTWNIVEKYIPVPDGKKIIEIDSVNNKFYSQTEKEVAFVGVSNILVVEHEGKIIIMDTRDIQNIKQVAAHFEN